MAVICSFMVALILSYLVINCERKVHCCYCRKRISREEAICINGECYCCFNCFKIFKLNHKFFI